MAEASTTKHYPPLKPRSQWRVIMNDDVCNQFGGNTTAQILQERVDYIAEAGVDVLAWYTASPDLCTYPTEVGEWLASAEHLTRHTSGQSWSIAHNIRALVESGLDPLAVAAERCHHHGMPFLATIRMNDTHHLHGYYNAYLTTQFFLDHQDWVIRDRAGQIIGGMDYAVPEVRAHRLAILREQVERYDIDGLELDFMRRAPFFQPDEGEQNASIMTDYICQVRQMLDEVAAERGRGALILGVRVPPTLDKCQRLVDTGLITNIGLDVAAWMHEARLDYLCPSDNGQPDYNIPVEDFVEIAQGTECRVFPTVHPNVTAQYQTEQFMTLERFRGAANNYFQFGAQGISTFNFMMGTIGTWHIQRHHLGSWTMMKEMHDPEALTKRERTYFYDHTLSPDRVIVINRQRDVGQRKAVKFRVAEDFNDSSWKYTLRFKPKDLSIADKLEFDINGVAVTERLESDFLFLMCDPPNSARYMLDLAGSPAVYGDNEFGVTLIEANPDLQECTVDYLGRQETVKVSPISITELEILVTKA